MESVAVNHNDGQEMLMSTLRLSSTNGIDHGTDDTATATVDVDFGGKYFDDKDQDKVKEEEQVPKIALMGHDRDSGKRSKDVVVDGQFEDLEFTDMQLSDDIVKGLKLCRYDKPTPIQLRAIPLGKLNYDLLLQAKSGTGKTCVFTVCILQQMVVTDQHIQALVVTPCREIAVQISYVIKSIGAFKDGLKVKEFIGGTSVAQSIRRSGNCHIAVGTPGRLAHMINDHTMDLSKVKVVALDEADKLMDPSFFDDIKVIFKALPATKQMIATSATYSDIVVQFLEKFMKNACKIQLDLDNLALCAVDQYMIDAKKIVGKQQQQRGSGGAHGGGTEIDEGFNSKFSCLKEIMRRVVYKQAIVFSNYQLRAEKIYESLKELGWDVDLLSASRSQEDRLLAFMALQQGKIKALVATDVASRGIDIEGVDMVINFDIPNDQNTYMHRVGRTGRFGSNGRALSICHFDSERTHLSKFQMNIHFTLWVIEDLEEINGINDKTKFHHTNRQLKSVLDSDVLEFGNSDDPDSKDWKETVGRILGLSLEDDCIEHYMMESGWKPLIGYQEVGEDIEKMENEFRKQKLGVCNERKALEGGGDVVGGVVEVEEQEDPFSSDTESEEDD